MQKLSKAYFQRLGDDGKPVGSALKVQFNPTEYTLNKGAQIAEVPIPGLDSPILQFVRGQTETLSLELFFDTTDRGMGQNATSVTTETDKFYQLIKIESRKHAPPICLFSWGDKSFPGNRTYGGQTPDGASGGQQAAGASGAEGGSQQRYGFKCIVESVRQRFTLFSPRGVPLRATLTVSLREYKTLAEQIRELNLQSADHTKAHVVEQGDTLSRVAWQAYGDPAEWRRIADANGLADPAAIRPGLILQIPRSV